MPTASRIDTVELRKQSTAAAIFECDTDPIANANGQCVFSDDIRQHPGTLIEIDQSHHIWRPSAE
jgi:hypothetical protein